MSYVYKASKGLSPDQKVDPKAYLQYLEFVKAEQARKQEEDATHQKKLETYQAFRTEYLVEVLGAEKYVQLLALKQEARLAVAKYRSHDPKAEEDPDAIHLTGAKSPFYEKLNVKPEILERANGIIEKKFFELYKEEMAEPDFKSAEKDYQGQKPKQAEPEPDRCSIHFPQPELKLYAATNHSTFDETYIRNENFDYGRLVHTQLFAREHKASDHDVVRMTGEATYGFWYTPPKTGRLSIRVIYRHNFGRFQLRRFNEWGWSASRIRHGNYIKSQVMASGCTSDYYQTAYKKWEGDDTRTLEQIPLVNGGYYQARLSSNGTVFRDQQVMITVGTHSALNGYTNDVTIRTESDFTHAIAYVEVCVK